MEIKRKLMYRSDLFVAQNVGTESQREDIISQIRVAQKIDPTGVNDSNDNCWRLMYCCEDIDWILKELEKLYDEVSQFYQSEDSFYKEAKKDELKVSYWANVNGYNSRNVFHAHKPKHFSAVYYLQGEGTGGLRFVNPANVLTDCNIDAPFTRDFTFLPADGDLVMWPSWMPHEVETNLSQRERINLTFDITVNKNV